MAQAQNRGGQRQGGGGSIWIRSRARRGGGAWRAGGYGVRRDWQARRAAGAAAGASCGGARIGRESGEAGRCGCSRGRRSGSGRSSGGGRAGGDGFGSSPAAGSGVDRGRRPAGGAGRGADQGLLVGAGDEGDSADDSSFNSCLEDTKHERGTSRISMDSPLLWIRVDPEMEYLAEIHFHQPIQMWINQLEKDKDVISQSQEITVLEKLPQLSFAVINALNNFLNDTKDTDLAGLLHLVKFYKSHRFDTDIGLPRPNDFHDIPEYFVLEEEKAIVIHTILFLAGINTLLQVHFGTRLPAVMAGSYTYIYTVVAIIISPQYVLFIGAPFERFVYTMRSLQGALIIAGVFEAVIGFFGIWRVFIRFVLHMLKNQIQNIAKGKPKSSCETRLIVQD
ncbi:hypothetical protein ZWY2020_018225 [Hordeum vulgare]|nr:hypothetical protein ZWY2020_018225 [Hordeum vulgare]